ncbi:thiamine phosphate synthase [Rhodobacteraceae bacterium 2CG4]|uniref:Thiamine phosphate synthase n=1 Tax=Halovulum marinum TaxID=2662447 RepID=A0A6L5Z0Z2_9RHOB|nr:thiamine phosphate synthase [Halovulum marinum]MSU90211.1 thiamine phosphate synthase [Halovulum marinum]
MSDAEPPKLYLTTPPQFDLSSFPDLLAQVCDAVPPACLRLALASRDEDVLGRAGDLLRAFGHARDIPVVIDDHHRLAERLGLDGVHLTDGARRVREVRKALGKDAIVGAFCGTSRHAAMTAGEIGADYVAFGPVTPSETLGDGSAAAPELFAWWAEMIEVPAVAEGGLTEAALDAVAPHADFLCLGQEVWAAADGPLAAVRRLAAHFGD